MMHKSPWGGWNEKRFNLLIMTKSKWVGIRNNKDFWGVSGERRWSPLSPPSLIIQILKYWESEVLQLQTKTIFGDKICKELYENEVIRVDLNSIGLAWSWMKKSENDTEKMQKTQRWPFISQGARSSNQLYLQCTLKMGRKCVPDL